MLKHSFLLVATVLTLGLAACSGDEKPAEPVQPATSEEPASPPPADPNAGAGSLSGANAETVYFAFDDYTLNADGQSKLTRLADKLKGSAGAVVQIEGHCDERGSVEYNLALGDRRAQSVKNFLSQLGVDAGRLSTISYGEEKPAADGHDEGAWSQNRRAQFVISAQ